MSDITSNIQNSIYRNISTIQDAVTTAKQTRLNPNATVEEIDNQELRYIYLIASEQYNNLGNDADSIEEMRDYKNQIDMLDISFLPASFRAKIANPFPITAQTSFNEVLYISLFSKYFSVCADINRVLLNAGATLLEVEEKNEADARAGRIIDNTANEMSSRLGIAIREAKGLKGYSELSDYYQTELGKSSKLVAHIDRLGQVMDLVAVADQERNTIDDLFAFMSAAFTQTEGYFRENIAKEFIAAIPPEYNSTALTTIIDNTKIKIQDLIKQQAADTELIKISADKESSVKDRIVQQGNTITANLTALQNTIAAIDRLHKAADQYRTRITPSDERRWFPVVDTALHSLVSDKLNALAAEEIKAAETAKAGGDMLAAYAHYKNAEKYLNENFGITNEVFAQTVTDGTKANRDTVAAALQDMAAKTEEVSTALKTKDVTTMINTLDNNPYANLYAALNGVTKENLLSDTIDAMTDPACTVVILNSKSFTETVKTPDSPLSAKLIQRTTDIVAELGLRGDIGILATLKEDIARNQNLLPRAQSEQLLNTLATLISTSNSVPRITPRSVSEITTTSSKRGEPTAPRPGSTSETHYTIPIADLGKFTAPGTSISVGDDITTIMLNTPNGNMPLYDAAMTTDYFQFANIGKYPIGFLFNDKIYLIDENGVVTDVLGMDNEMFVITNNNGQTTITFKSGKPYLTSGGDEVTYIGSSEVDVSANAPSITRSETPLVWDIAGATDVVLQSSSGKKIITVTDGKINLSEDDIRELYYNNGQIVLSGSNGTTALNFIDIVGTDNFKHPGDAAIAGYLNSINFDTQNPYSILNSDFVPSAILTGTNKSSATATVTWPDSDNIISLEPLDKYAGAFIKKGGRVYGHGTIGVEVLVVKEDGSTETRTIFVELPQYPPIFDAIASGLPQNTDIDFYRYTHGVLTRAAFNNYNAANTEKLNFLSFWLSRGMDGMRLNYRTKLPDNSLSTFSTTKYLMFNNDTVNTAMFEIMSKNGEAGFGDEDLPVLLVLVDLLKNFPDDGQDKAKVIKHVKDEYKIILEESDLTSLYDVALKISGGIALNNQDSYLVTSSTLSSENGLSLTATPSFTYDGLGGGLGKLELSAKLGLTWKTEFNTLEAELKYALPVAVGTAEDSFGDYSQSRVFYKVTNSFGTPEFQGFVSAQGTHNLAHNNELSSAYYYGLAGIAGLWLQPGHKAGENQVSSFDYRFGFGVQGTTLDGVMQAISLPVIGDIGWNIRHFRLGVDATMLIHANSGLDPEKTPYAIRNEGDKDITFADLGLSLRGNNIWSDPFFVTKNNNRFNFPWSVRLNAAKGTIASSVGFKFTNTENRGWSFSLEPNFKLFDEFFQPRESGFDMDIMASANFDANETLSFNLNGGVRNVLGDTPLPSFGAGVTIKLK